MTDSELLQLAAKATGHTLVNDVELSLDGEVVDDNWLPLEDQADAEWLAQHAGLTVVREGNSVQVFWHINDGDFWIDESSMVDIEPIMRRAIVRAAAEIGKATP